MRPLVEEFLSEGPKVRRARGYLELGTCRLREVGASDAIADDPMLGGIALEVALRAQDVNGGCNGAAHRQAADVPQSNLAGNPSLVRSSGITSKTEEYHSRQASN
jgi:hypothetical protein